MMAFWSLLVALQGIMGVGLGYPTGAPTPACTAMLPRHRNTVDTSSESPYRLEVDDSTVTPGGEIIVTITGTETFRGFLLQARRVGGGSTAAVGRFTANDAGMRPVACDGRDNSALTHTSRAENTTLEAVWRAPRRNVGAVQFIATVVKSFEEYWIGITSATVTMVRRSSTPDSSTDVSRSTPTTMAVSTTSPQATTSAVSTTDASSSTTGEPNQGTESRTTLNETNLTNYSDNTNGTNSSSSNVPFASTTPSGEQETTSYSNETSANFTDNNTDSSTPYEGLENASTHLTPDLAIETTAKPRLNETATLSETTTHFRFVTDDDSSTVNDAPTTLSESYTSGTVMESTTPSNSNISRTLPGDDHETSTFFESSSISQNGKTTGLTRTGTVPSFTADTSGPSNNSTTTADTSTTVSANGSTEMETIVAPYDNSTAIVDSTTAVMEPSTTISNDTSIQSQNDTTPSQIPFTDTFTEPTLYNVSTTSTTLPDAIPTQSSNESSTLTRITSTTPFNTTATETLITPFNVSTTPQKPHSQPDNDSITDMLVFPETPVTTSTEAYPVETSTTHPQRPTERITGVSTAITTTFEMFDSSTTIPHLPLETTEDTETGLSTESLSTRIVTPSRSTRDPAVISESTTESAETTTGSTSEPTMTTVGSTSEFTTGSTGTSTSQTTVMETTDTSTMSTTVANTKKVPITPQISTASVITEEANEIRMRITINSIVFTVDLEDSSSEYFGTVAGQVEKDIWDLYIREGMTTIDSVTVLRIMRGSVIPEVRILASKDFDDSSRSAWLSVMYNEVHSTGRLGNFSVSDVSAVTSDGTFAEVDPCVLLPCPVSMVCYVYQSDCLSNCYLNGNYCLNGGTCKEPKTGTKQLASCRCDSRHEGDRCDLATPPRGNDNSNMVVAAVWGSIGSACLVLIVIITAWLTRSIRRKRHWRHTAKLMGSAESGTSSGRAQRDSYARRLTSIRAGVLIDLANISGSDGDSTNASRQLSREDSFSDAESVDQPRFIDGGVHIGGMPDILQGASTTDYELDFMNRSLSQKRKSVSFNDVTEMIDFVATENFALSSKEAADGNFQVRWDFQVDRSDSRETDS